MNVGEASGLGEPSRTEVEAVDEAAVIEASSPVIERRIPHLGHAALFVSFTAMLLMAAELILYLLGRSPAIAAGGSIRIAHPKLQLAAEGVAYLASLIAAWAVFPLLWRRPFGDGLRWRWEAARGQASKLIPLGLLLGMLAAAAEHFITTPKSTPMDAFLLTRSNAWLLMVFGTVVAPVFEEICFRGFLMPAFAIAYDWLSLPRTPEARLQWQTTTALSPAGLIFSAILSSVLFALLHAQQVGYTWGVLVVLFTVSLVLTFVRVKTQSVAASTLVHGSYNFFIFLMLMIATGGFQHMDRVAR